MTVLQTVSDDVKVSWFAATGTTQTVTDDIKVTWTSNSIYAYTTASDDAVIHWTNTANSVTILSQTVEAWVSVSMTATSANPATSYTWNQTSGPSVTLGANGSACSFDAPGLATASSIGISCLATYRDGTSASGSATITVQPATEFFLKGGSWNPMRIRTYWNSAS